MSYSSLHSSLPEKAAEKFDIATFEIKSWQYWNCFATFIRINHSASRAFFKSDLKKKIRSEPIYGQTCNLGNISKSVLGNWLCSLLSVVLCLFSICYPPAVHFNRNKFERVFVNSPSLPA